MAKCVGRCWIISFSASVSMVVKILYCANAKVLDRFCQLHKNLCFPRKASTGVTIFKPISCTLYLHYIFFYYPYYISFCVQKLGRILFTFLHLLVISVSIYRLNIDLVPKLQRNIPCIDGDVPTMERLCASTLYRRRA